VLARYESATRKDGTPATIAIIRTAQGEERAVWCTQVVLREKLLGLDPGTAIYARYEGRRTSAAGRAYHNYSIAVEQSKSTTPIF
jgi:hypothetical protein